MNADSVDMAGEEPEIAMQRVGIDDYEVASVEVDNDKCAKEREGKRREEAPTEGRERAQ